MISIGFMEYSDKLGLLRGFHGYQWDIVDPNGGTMSVIRIDFPQLYASNRQWKLTGTYLPSSTE